MSATATPTPAVLEQLKGLADWQKAMEAKLASLGQPVQHGLSPGEALQQRLGQQKELAGKAVVFDADGNPIPVKSSRIQRSIGWGEYLKDLAAACERGGESSEKLMLDKHGAKLAIKTALAESTGTTGGYTVPPQFVAQLLTLAIDSSIVRPMATTIPMTSRSALIPALDYTRGASGVSPLLGGVSATWTEEAATRTESEPTFKQIEMTARELSMYTVASNTLLADSAIALDAFLAQIFSAAIAWYSDYAFLQGNGAGKPLGVLNAPATIQVSRASAGRFKMADASQMLSRLLASSHGSACWVMSQSVIPELIQMADNGGNVVFIPNFGVRDAAQGGGIAMKMPMMLLGLPIFFTEKVPVLGSAGDVNLLDLSKYLIGDRMELQLDVSPHVKFLQNQMVWRVVARMDGQPWLTQSITLADGSTTVSPFVSLAA